MESQVDPTIVAKFVLMILFVVFVVYIILEWLRYKKMEQNNGPWKFEANKFPYLLRGDQLVSVADGTYTISHYLYIEGSTEMRSNPQPIWRWGVSDPIRRIFPVMMASYIPAQEQLLFEFANSATGDENRVSTLNIPNMVQHRWFHILIISEGRTLDIYLNGNHAKSIQLPNVLKQTSDGIQMIGNSGILGTTSMWKVLQGRLTDEEIKKEYRSTSDKTGKPILPVNYDFKNLLTFPKLNLCPGMPWCEDIKGDCKTYVDYEYA